MSHAIQSILPDLHKILTSSKQAEQLSAMERMAKFRLNDSSRDGPEFPMSLKKWRQSVALDL
jgi:hypothetical protein